MNRFLAVTATSVLLLLACVGAAAQSRPAFEVVSIKPALQPTPELIQSGYRPSFTVDDARVRITGYQLFGLLTRAFRVQPPQVDAPDFARSEYFEIQATLPEGATREQV